MRTKRTNDLAIPTPAVSVAAHIGTAAKLDLLSFSERIAAMRALADTAHYEKLYEARAAFNAHIEATVTARAYAAFDAIAAI